MDAPDLTEAIRAAIDARAGQVRTALPARVMEYNRATQVADVRPEVWPEGEEAPIVPTVPVLWPRGGNAYLHFNLTPHTKFTPGDTGLLVCCEADLAEWRRTGEAAAPADTARHHLQNAVFIPGLVPSGHDLDHFPTTTVLAASDLRLGVHDATKAALHADLLVDLNSVFIAITAWANPGIPYPNWAAASAAWAAPGGPGAQVATLLAGIAASSYESPSVKVED